MTILASPYTQLPLYWAAAFLGLVTAQVLVKLGHIKRSEVAKAVPVGICVVFAAMTGLFL